MFLHVQASNHAAKRLYAKQGFQLVASLPGYYLQQLQQDTLADELAATSRDRVAGSISTSSFGSMSSGSVSLSSLSSLSLWDAGGSVGGAHSQGLRAALTAGMARRSSSSTTTNSQGGATWDPSFHTSPDAELQVAVLVPHLAAAAAAAAVEAQQQLQQQAQDRTASTQGAGTSVSATGLTSTAAGAVAAAVGPLLPKFTTGSSSSSSANASRAGSSNSSSSSSRRKAEWVELPPAPPQQPDMQQEESKAAAVMGVLMGALGSVLGFGPRNRRPPVRRGRRLQVGGEDMLLVKGEDGEVYIVDEEDSLTAEQKEQQPPDATSSSSSSSNAAMGSAVGTTTDQPQVPVNSSNSRVTAVHPAQRSSGLDCPALRRCHSSIGTQLCRSRPQLYPAKLVRQRAVSALQRPAGVRGLSTSLSRL
jgi:hypothetical protein